MTMGRNKKEIMIVNASREYPDILTWAGSQAPRRKERNWAKAQARDASLAALTWSNENVLLLDPDTWRKQLKKKKDAAKRAREELSRYFQ